LAAKRPSKRRHHREMEFELKLIPVISLLCVLIPILLQGAAFVHTAGQDVNLPSTDEVRYVGPVPPAATETLTLALTDRGFTLATGEGVLARIPRLDGGGFDLDSLEAELRKAKERFPAHENIILLIADPILYDEIIHAMDRCRPLFPSIVMADRVETPEQD